MESNITSVPMSNAPSKKKRFIYLIIILAVIIPALLFVVVSVSKVGVDKSEIDNTVPKSPTANFELIKKQDRELAAFAKSNLQPQYVPSQVQIEDGTPYKIGGLGINTKIVTVDNEDFVFSATTEPDKSNSLFIFKDLKGNYKNDQNGVLEVFSQYFLNVSNNDSWKTRSLSGGMTIYEALVSSSDDFFESKLIYAAPHKLLADTVVLRLVVCKISSGAKSFPSKSCANQ